MRSARLAARIAESYRLQLGQEAEGQGLRAASVFEKPFQFSTDPYRQARFELGFLEGRALLRMEVEHARTDSDGAGETAEGGLRAGVADDGPVQPPAEGEPPAPDAG